MNVLQLVLLFLVPSLSSNGKNCFHTIVCTWIDDVCDRITHKHKQRPNSIGSDVFRWRRAAKLTRLCVWERVLSPLPTNMHKREIMRETATRLSNGYDLSAGSSGGGRALCKFALPPKCTLRYIKWRRRREDDVVNTIAGRRCGYACVRFLKRSHSWRSYHSILFCYFVHVQFGKCSCESAAIVALWLSNTSGCIHSLGSCLPKQWNNVIVCVCITDVD